MRVNVLRQFTGSALRRIGLIDAAPAETEAQRRARQLDESHAFFSRMASRPDIASVRFERGGAIVALADGRQYWLDPSTPAGRLYSVPFTGQFEPRETQFVKHTVKPGWVCIDVGACFGWFTVLLSRLVGPRGRVHAFEPVPDTAEMLKRNIRLNNADNVGVTCAALDETPGSRDLFVPDIGVSGSFALHEYDRSFRQFAVPTTTLDDYVDRHNIARVDFIKADIEGAEWAMLKGAARTLERFRPAMLIEVQAESTRRFGHVPDDVFRWLSERGYQAHTLNEAAGEQPRLNATGANDAAAQTEYNFIMLPRQRRGALAA